MDFDKKDKASDSIFTQIFNQVLGEHSVDNSTPTAWSSSRSRNRHFCVSLFAEPC